MRLASFEIDGTATWGAVTNDGVVDIGRHLPGCPTLLHALQTARLSEAASLAEHHAADRSLSEARLLKPIHAPEKIVCVGVNYAERNEEYQDGSDRPKYASLFMRTPGSLVAHGDAILRPPESVQLDYEGEIALVIGKAGRRIPEAAARDHIAGLTLCNEGTIRDWLRHGKFNVTQGKNFERTGSLGPWLVTSDEFPHFDNLEIRTTVNGEVRQHDTTARLMFPFSRLVAYISTFMELKPGDIISTGTPTGAGARFDPPRWLKPGDIVEISSPGIGVLSNTVVDEAA